MGCGASVSQNENSEEQIYQNEELNRLLQEKGDVSDYSIPQIALCQMSYPPITPSCKSKKELLAAGSDSALQSRDITINTASLLNHTCNELVKMLTEELVSNLSKVRAIYSLIASLDIAQISAPAEEALIPKAPLEYVLKKIKNYQGNHAHLFCALCRVACVPCEVVSGYNKSSSYQLGKQIDRKKLAAQWNAVYVEQEWRLVDCFWSTVCVVGGEDSDQWDVLDVNGRLVTDRKISGDNKITHRINDFYFLPDPHSLKSTHIPRRKEWQLLPEKEQISITDFEQAAYTRERYYELGIRTSDSELDKCRLKADQGQVTIDLEIIEDSPSIDFKYMLFKAKSSKTDSSFEKFVLFERGTGFARYETNIPLEGEFKLDIFGKDGRKHNSMDLVCSYIIECVTGSDDKEPLPDDPAIGWGAETGHLSAFGIKPVTHKTGTITTTTGTVDIKFSLSQPVELMCLMLSNSHTKEQLDQYIYLEVTNEECIIHVTLPKKGVYACELFANEEGLPGEMQNVCNYVIKYHNKKATHNPLPYLPRNRAGAFTKVKELGVEVVTPTCPVVVTKDNKFEIQVKASDGIILYSSLHHCEQKSTASNQQVCYIKEEGRFDLTLERSGTYCFALYTGSENGSQLQNVYNCVIHNQAESTAKQSGTSELPKYKVIHTKEGGAQLPISKSSSENILASMSRERGLADESSCKVNIADDGKKATIDIKVFENGVYLVDVYARSNQESTVILKERYKVIHEGGVVNKKEVEVEEKEEEVESEEETPEEESEEDVRIRELKQKLLNAIASGDEENLASAIEEFKAAGDIPDPKKILAKAERELQIIRMRRRLVAVTQSEDIEELEETLIEANSIKHRGKLDKEIAAAKKRLEKLRNMDELRNAVFKLDQRTVAEIKSFSSPPEPIKIVMKGTLLLLGNTKGDMKDWRSIVALIGKTGKESLKRRVMEFRIRNLTMEVADEAKQLLSPMSLTEVRDASTGAATFYLWSLAMIEEAEQRHEKQ
ncbi:hypothetical protein EB796_003437 [Bugula neritina]|uniref:Transglutaminase-like domain-containing protein n=1 Tax=Bugula neritina TaxID=10212 RepID=A0A7J7KHV2_BUGNE|nr:hypothetical protein EB796_003437 [Bugula neritina]